MDFISFVLLLLLFFLFHGRIETVELVVIVEVKCVSADSDAVDVDLDDSSF